MEKKRGRGFLIVFLIMMSALTVYFVFNIFFSPYWDSVYAPTGYFSLASMRYPENDSETFTKEQACEDIDYLVKVLGRIHPDCIDSVPQEILDCAEKQKQSFTDEVSSYDVWRACARVLHLFDDAHTMAGPSYSLDYLKEHKEIVASGAELAAINGVSVEDIFHNNEELVSYELDPWGIRIVEGLVSTKEGLKYLGVYSDTLEYTYRYSDGSETVKTYSSKDFYSEAAMNTDETEDTPYSSQIISEKSAAILTLDSCVYDMDFREFIYNFFKDINEKNIGSLVIDIRENSGGTSQVFDEIMIYLDHDKFSTAGGEWRLGPYMMTWEPSEQKVTHMDDVSVFAGDIYVLTSNNTFSSGTLIAEYMQDNGFATVIGEECGSMPAGYGDVSVFQTPNAAVTFQVSTKFFDRVNEELRDEPLTPDIRTSKNMALLEAMDIISK